ncbi:PREDICTED: uncharacterized protein LOC109162265 [Ipomoea nil]|uniref:uncharacterized protein LOC109162265 n=1 Tax=Ipomoea nil TaxID=35883 RepID=UPI000901DC1D|nr:PREDICTED: uncharacterized protein LOC109162265 [Ipomoea nil]
MENEYKKLHVSPVRTRAQSQNMNAGQEQIQPQKSAKRGIVCLIEPFKELSEIGHWAVMLGFENRFCGSDKTWVFWDRGVTLISIEIGDQLINLEATVPEIGNFNISFIYAKCDRSIRLNLWEQIESMAEGPMKDQKWSLIGDFNCILKSEEKRGGQPYSMWKSRDFQNCVDSARLREVVFYGNPFTWWNGRRGEQAVWERLDRGFVNENWEGSLKTHIHHYAKLTSDHSPLIMSVEPQVRMSRRPFSFLNSWGEHEQFLGIVREAWQERVNGNEMYTFMTKLKRVKEVLKKWNWETFGNIFKKVEELEGKMRELEEKLQERPTDETLLEYKRVQALLQRQVRMEESYWQQKAHSQWVVEGERNSKYFQGLVRERRSRQIIHKIMSDEGVWVEDQGKIAGMAVEFFQQLFTAEATNLDPSIFDCLQVVVTEQENQALVAEPSMEEVRSSVFSMNANSAAGPDGFGGGFYQLCWEIIKEDLLKMVRSFFAGKSLTKAITSTSIVLIPKVSNPANFGEYRPISLSNFCSKIITKIMVLRLAGVLNRVISPVQAGFVKGRSITDNILLAQEICHGMKASNEDIVLKLDMAKAYDRMDWGCIALVLTRLGFCKKWIDLVLNSINNIWYSVIVNGEARGFFHSSRGLRQGDPLSPSLFILAAELFSRKGGGSGGSYRGGGTYEAQSGQLINRQKSAFYMQAKATLESIERVREITGCQFKSFPFTYLGCPIYQGRKKTTLFDGLTDRVANRCKGWQARILSQGGKAVLIKTILQAMPTHMFYAISPPKAVIKQIESLLADFFWGKAEGKKKYHWGSWKTLARPTEEGGVGFQRMQELVDAASVKLWWNFRKGNSLWSQFLIAKYCKETHPVVRGWQYNDSHVWKRMVQIRDIAEPQIAWRIGEGKVNVWWDN